MITIYTTEAYDRWFAALRDRQAKSRIDARVRRLSLANFGDVRSVGGGISELRIHYGPGYRIYLTRRGSEVVIRSCWPVAINAPSSRTSKPPSTWRVNCRRMKWAG